MDCSPPGFSFLWDFLGKNTGVGCSFLLQGIFLNLGLNPSLLHLQADSLPLSHQGSPLQELLPDKIFLLTPETDHQRSLPWGLKVTLFMSLQDASTLTRVIREVTSTLAWVRFLDHFFISRKEKKKSETLEGYYGKLRKGSLGVGGKEKREMVLKAEAARKV